MNKYAIQGSEQNAIVHIDEQYSVEIVPFISLGRGYILQYCILYNGEYVRNKAQTITTFNSLPAAVHQIERRAGAAP